MLKFVTFAVKVQLNVHDLNNEAVAGNVTDVRIMDYLIQNEKGEWEKVEAPAVSGRMLKHWHYEGIRHLIINGSYSSVPLCAGCKAGEPIRPSEIRNDNLTQVAKPEEDAVKSCIICDIHGYLIAQRAEGEGGVSARRVSRAMFSWLMPVLGTDTTSRQVVHTRVSQIRERQEGEQAAQMLYYKSYASGIYAFISALDVDRIGLVELNLGSNNPYAVDNNNGRKERIKVAIESYRYLISGQMGASLSHAIPHWDPIGILVCYSEESPLPFPVSPMYSDYVIKTKGVMPEGTVFLYWGDETLPEGINKKETIDEIFKELMQKI